MDTSNNTQISDSQDENVISGNNSDTPTNGDIAERDEHPEDLDMRWIRTKCLKCGYTYEGSEPLEKCPKCGNTDPDLFD